MQQLQQQRILAQQGAMQTPRPMAPRPPTDPATAQKLLQLQQYQMMARAQQLQQISTPGVRTPASFASTPGTIGMTPGLTPGMTPIRVPHRIPIRIPAQPRKPIVISTSAAAQSKSGLLPPQNTYAPRLKYGHTSLVTPMSPKETTKKRPRFREEVSDEEMEESESDQSFEDSEESDERIGRKTRATTKPKEEPEVEVEPEVKEIPAFAMKKRTRLLHTTKHDYEKINLYRLEPLASVQEVLIPIQLDFDIDGFKIQDQFTWNLNEAMISTEKFAEYLCNDLDINPQQYAQMISRNIKSQIEEFKRFYQHNDFPVDEDSRVMINLDISVGKVHLRDRFEWDLASEYSPECFASNLAKDLGLGGEFVTLIAYSIHEQIYRIRQSGEYEPTFPIEKPLRSEEEAKGWAPFVDCGEKPEDAELNMEEDRKQR
jgi:chromatin structure-remodeling complex subunit SFH1